MLSINEKALKKITIKGDVESEAEGALKSDTNYDFIYVDELKEKAVTFSNDKIKVMLCALEYAEDEPEFGWTKDGADMLKEIIENLKRMKGKL